MTPQATNRRRQVDFMLRPQLEAPCLHLKRARDREGGSGTAWCADYLQGGAQGRCKRRQISHPCRMKYTKTMPKTAGFPQFMALKLPKTPFFAQKYLIRYTPKMYFEKYINFKIFHYLMRCGVIPIQSFGSHIRPLPSRFFFSLICLLPSRLGLNRGRDN